MEIGLGVGGGPAPACSRQSEPGHAHHAESARQGKHQLLFTTLAPQGCGQSVLPHCCGPAAQGSGLPGVGREGTDPPEAVLCTEEGVGGNIESKRSASPCHHRHSLHFPRKTNCLTDASTSELKYKMGRVILKSLRPCRQLERQLRDDASNLDRMPLNCWGFARFARGPPVVGAVLRPGGIRRALGHRPHPSVVPLTTTAVVAANLGQTNTVQQATC